MPAEIVNIILCICTLFVMLVVAFLGGIVQILISFRSESRDEFRSIKEVIFSHRHRRDGSVETSADRREKQGRIQHRQKGS